MFSLYCKILTLNRFHFIGGYLMFINLKSSIKCFSPSCFFAKYITCSLLGFFSNYMTWYSPCFFYTNYMTYSQHVPLQITLHVPHHVPDKVHCRAQMRGSTYSFFSSWLLARFLCIFLKMFLSIFLSRFLTTLLITCLKIFTAAAGSWASPACPESGPSIWTSTSCWPGCQVVGACAHRLLIRVVLHSCVWTPQLQSISHFFILNSALVDAQANLSFNSFL